VSDLKKTPEWLAEIQRQAASPPMTNRPWDHVAQWRNACRDLLAALVAAENRADQLALECHKFAARTGEVETKNVRLKEQLAELYDKSKERMERAEKELAAERAKR
jgi:hypothetical protein